jgi:hypothetical protein
MKHTGSGRQSAHHDTAAPARTSGRTRDRRRALAVVPGLALAMLPGVAAAEPMAEPSGTESAVRSAAADVCETGEFCLWPEADYSGTVVRLDLRNTNPDECAPLPDGMSARSFTNRIDRHVTVYQDAACSTEGDFSTYPGPETFVPRSPYVVRAVQIWN